MIESRQIASRTPHGFKRQLGVLGSVATMLTHSLVFDSFSLYGACQAPLSMGFSSEIEPLSYLGSPGFVEGDGKLVWVKGEFYIYYESENHRI